MTRFTIDPVASRVWIDALSSLHAINAVGAGLQGWVDAELIDGRLDPEAVPQAHLEVEVARLSSGNPLYDREMRRRVDSRRFPRITGDLHSVEVDGHPNRYRAGGAVTFRGQTCRYAGDIALSVLGDPAVGDQGQPGESGAVRALRLEGSQQFDVRDFGMQPPKILAFSVQPEVDVRIVIVATEAVAVADAARPPVVGSDAGA